VSSNEKNAKFCQKRSCGVHLSQFWNFGPPNLSQMVEARNFKFGMETDGGEF